MDWASFDSMTGAGALPQMAALRTRGVAGWLAGAPLSDGPAPWASIACGLQPETHGVWRDREPWAGGLRPTGKASWRASPIWTRLEAAGISTGSVAWPATRPGEAWPGVHLDDGFAEASGRLADDWALPPHCAPPNIREAIRQRRVHPTTITGAMLAPLVPGLARIDQSRDQILPALARGMARAATIQSASVWMLAEHGSPDAIFVHQRWLDRVRQGFATRRDPVFAEVVAGAWRFLDGLIGRLAAVAGPDTLVMVVSPGWRGSPGVFLAAGGAVEAAAEVHGADLLDIAPTVLARFGLEDPSLPGRRIRPMAAAGPLAPAPVPKIDMPAKPDRQMLFEVRRQGYRPPPRPSRAWRARGLAELSQMMLERAPEAAGATAQASLNINPGNVLALRIRVRAHVALGEAEPLPALGDLLLKAAPDRGWGALAHGVYHVLKKERVAATSWLTRAEGDPDVGTLLTVAAVWLSMPRMANAARVFNAVLAQDPTNVSAEIGLAMTALARRDFMAAETGLMRALKVDPGRAAAYLQLAQVYARSGRKHEAARAARFALRLGVAPAMAAAAKAGRLRG
jgi:hypothetical protein